METILTIKPDAPQVLESLAEYFVESARTAIAKTGHFSVALSGGSSPKQLYELLAADSFRQQIEWEKISFFFGDERYVPLTDPASNYLMVKKALFDPLQIPAANIYAVDTSLEPDQAAAMYGTMVSGYFQSRTPCFDLVLLGLGDNSHTASLFPHTQVLYSKTAAVEAVYVEEQKAYRITFNAPLINHAKKIAFLVYGAGKAAAVATILEPAAGDFNDYPARLIAPPNGSITWFLDAAAASQLQSKDGSPGPLSGSKN